MATVIKKVIFSLLLLMTASVSFAHTIYAPNDIPFLDNRFRIDPLTKQVTFILNHSQGPQLVVLVRPDGSKLYYQNHPDNVAWVAGKNIDIITIDKPMAGPWQAIASLDGDNRIKLISSVTLKTNRLPLKLYAGEYLTTHASLYNDQELMTDKAYLSNAKLSISLIGEEKKYLRLYRDDGKNYDALPFDGTLTAHLFINLDPGRYLLSIHTKNNVFMRTENQDAVVFPTPITYKVSQAEYGGEDALFTFTADTEELVAKSISISGTIKDANNKVFAQVIAHSADNISEQGIFSITHKVTYGDFSFSGKAYATTLSGREIELQLPTLNFSLNEKFAMPPININEAATTEIVETPPLTSIWDNIRVIIAGIVSTLLLIAIVVFILLRRRKKNKQLADDDNLSLDALSMTELQPESIDLNPIEN